MIVEPNEVEERRVIRLLAGVAEDVPALPAAEIERAIEAAARFPSGYVRRRRTTRSFSAIAAAAVMALAFLVQVDAPAERSSSAASGGPALATFPEGNALQLLLAARETR